MMLVPRRKAFMHCERCRKQIQVELPARHGVLCEKCRNELQVEWLQEFVKQEGTGG